MRVDYHIGFHMTKSEWICFEHEGYARRKAQAWRRQRTVEPLPESVEDAVAWAQHGRLAPTRAITVRSISGDEFERIIGYELGDVPPPVDDQDLPEGALEFPFGFNAVTAEVLP
jgi:DNA repair protein RadD